NGRDTKFYVSTIPRLPSRRRSEREFQSHLNLTRVARRRELAERAWIGDFIATVGHVRDARIDAEPLRMIEDVEELGAVLQFEPLGELEILEQRKVEVGESGAAQEIATGVAERAVLRARKDGRIKP